MTLLDMLHRDCKDCVHFNSKSLQDKTQHYCSRNLKAAACFGCNEYKLKQQSETNDLLENYTIKEIEGIEPMISYNGNIFLSVEELHQWKIEHIWNGIDIAVTEEDMMG